MMTGETKIQTPNKINPLATGLAGMVIGAGITAAAAAALRDKKNREMLQKALKTTGTKAMKYIDTLKREAGKHAGKGVEKIQKAVKDATEIKGVKKVAAKAL